MDGEREGFLFLWREVDMSSVLPTFHMHVIDNESSKHPESQAKAMWGQSGVYTRSLEATWCLPQQNKPKGRCPFLHRTAECKGGQGRSPFAGPTSKCSWKLAHSQLEDSTCQVGYRRSTRKVGFGIRGQTAKPTGLQRHTASVRRWDFLPTWKLLQRQKKCPL